MPLEQIHSLLQQRERDVDAWFESKWQGVRPLPYFSCDVRHASFKIGVVDTNLFPAGFNNLCNAFTKDTAKAFDAYFNAHFPGVKNVLLYGENHTRNKFYLLNLLKLQGLIEAGGRSCRVTLPLESYPEPRLSFALDESHALVIDAVARDGGRLVARGTGNDEFVAELVLSNNDFSAGAPKDLEGLSIPVVPSPRLGWHNRAKSTHFEIVSALVAEFGGAFDIDPWKLMPITTRVEGVSEDNLGELANAVDSVLNDVRKKYAEHGVQESPYVFIKNDSGTYGLGIVTVSSAEELSSLNRKKRGKLFSAKAGNQTNRFLVQEGIPTVDTYSGFPLEPVIYGVGNTPVAGFFRLHEGKDPFESLNAPGMSFSCLCLHKLDEPHESYFLNCKDKQRLVCGAKFVTRFAALAAALEADKLESDSK